MELKQISNQELLNRLDKLVRTERKLTFLAEKHIQKNLGKKPTSGDQSHTKKSTPSFTTERKRGHIRITVRRRILEKAQHCCEYVDPKTRRRCQSKYQVQVDHFVPLARGGSDEEANLRALCRTHNLLMARHWGLS